MWRIVDPRSTDFCTRAAAWRSHHARADPRSLHRARRPRRASSRFHAADPGMDAALVDLLARGGTHGGRAPLGRAPHWASAFAGAAGWIGSSGSGALRLVIPLVLRAARAHTRV